MKHVILIIILALNSTTDLHAQDFCSTPMEMDNTTRGVFLSNNVKRTLNANYFLRVYFHLVRMSDTSGGVIVQNKVQTAFNTLNSDFNPHGIYFIWDGLIDYINNDNLYNTPGPNIFSINSHINGIDIYLYGENVEDGGYANGIAGGTEYYIGGYLSAFPTLYLADTHVVSHEMGHVLGLYHTHHGTSLIERDPSTCAELVNGSNSGFCGDCIEDTPADPFLNFDVDPSTGQWYGFGAIDANGDMYQPDTHLIMSYTHPLCMSYFSIKQGERMNYAIGNVLSLQSVDVANSLSVIGPSNPFGANVYYVQNLPDGFSVSWSFTRSSGATSGWTLQTNTPTVNRCTFSYTTRVALSGTLTADIYKDSILVRTINKTLEYTPMYLGTYYQNDTFHFNNPQNIPETAFYDGQHLTVIPKCNVYIDFDIPVGYGVYHTGDNLLEWTNNGQGSVVLRFPYSRTQWQYQTIYGTCQNQSYEFYVDCRPDNGLIDDPILDLDYFGETLVITLIREDVADTGNNDDYQRGAANTVNNDNWNLVIINAVTGRHVYFGRVNGDSKHLSTAGWPKGLYVVKAQFGDQSLTQKIVVK